MSPSSLDPDLDLRPTRQFLRHLELPQPDWWPFLSPESAAATARRKRRWVRRQPSRRHLVVALPSLLPLPPDLERLRCPYPVHVLRSGKIEPLLQLFDNESTAAHPWKARSRIGSNGGRAVEREPGSEREGEVAERWRRRRRWTGRRVVGSIDLFRVSVTPLHPSTPVSVYRETVDIYRQRSRYTEILRDAAEYLYIPIISMVIG
ncbi:unnamed protein product [Linum trigynum]|uniref:Uncharacterized protein n=1 Tax=Linum trigynum TaxID=586398 RepID=A0AAV2FNP1_9ROSI